MVESTTAIYKLVQPDIGGSKETWGNYLNGDLARIDTELSLQNQSQWWGMQRADPGSELVTVKKYDTSGNAVDTKNLAEDFFRTAARPLYYANDVIDNPGTYLKGNKPGTLVPQRQLYRALDLLMPVGTVIIWAGLANAIPAGWHLCDGAGSTTGIPIEGGGGATQIIPDLRGFFVIGAFEPTNASVIKQFYINGTAGVFGHTHPLTIGNHVLTRAEIPPHTHGTDAPGTSDLVLARNTAAVGLTGGTASAAGAGYTAQNVNTTTGELGGGAHTHENSHVDSPVNDPDSPFYALCYIIKIRYWQGWTEGVDGPI